MRIGLFTDTYRPSINGIVFVVESLKKHLESQGHEVYIFCPGSSIRPGRHAEEFDEDEHVIRFPNGKDVREIVKMYLPRRERVQWNIDIVERILTIIYSKCDAVIALSRKSKAQLESWQNEENYQYEVTMLPNGVDRIKPATDAQLKGFKQTYGIDEKDEIFGFVGRLGSEKNLAMLIPAFDMVAQKRPKARLLFVGDFEFRETLERLASESTYPDRITFTGSLPRESLGVAYGAMDVFVFPSLTDTQGWVLHEAALAGLPIVLIDKEVSEVVVDGESGIYAENSAESVAAAVTDLLSHPKKRQEFGAESQRLARHFTEKRQVAKLAKLYERIVETDASEEE
jgi:1,2-diacylglycerol 3-alpha-glucosyltransferase